MINIKDFLTENEVDFKAMTQIIIVALIYPVLPFIVGYVTKKDTNDGNEYWEKFCNS